MIRGKIDGMSVSVGRDGVRDGAAEGGEKVGALVPVEGVLRPGRGGEGPGDEGEHVEADEEEDGAVAGAKSGKAALAGKD